MQMLPFLSVRERAIPRDPDEKEKNRGTAPEKERGSTEGSQLPSEKDSGNVDLCTRERKREGGRESVSRDRRREILDPPLAILFRDH